MEVFLRPESYQSLPKSPGVYLFQNASGQVIYVGKAKSLKDRVSSYFPSNPDLLLPKTARLTKEIAKISHIVVESEIDALLLEANLIRKYQPRYNVDWKDGKSYPLIEITLSDPVPFVRYARMETNPKARYFGPYPTGSDLTSVLRFLRRLFPFVSSPHPGNRSCLRSHLGLCPCPDVFTNPEVRVSYKKTLRRLIQFLEGKRDRVQRELVKEMAAASKAEEFEKAGVIKKKLETLAYIASSRRQPWEYELNPNLLIDQRLEEQSILAKLVGVPHLGKIECYDISNTSGRQATGAQVVFVDGLPEKKFYRRYRIKLKNTPDDYAMLIEVLKRRLHSDVPLPDLFVIDGGKGQLQAAKSVLGQNVRVLALAKRLETIFLDSGKEINLPPSSPALKLLQRLRDEAHRFSRKYHFLLRTKKMLS